MLLVDCLIDYKTLIPMETVLDLGCGTGIGGIACALLNSNNNNNDMDNDNNNNNNNNTETETIEAINITKKIVLSDREESPILKKNIDLNINSNSNVNKIISCNFILHQWNSKDLPLEIACPNNNNDKGKSNNCNDSINNDIWDLVLCSDVLYEQESHASFLKVLKSIKFKTLVLTYKRRHDEAESNVLHSLEQLFNVLQIEPPLINLQSEQLHDLYAFLLTNKNEEMEETRKIKVFS